MRAKDAGKHEEERRENSMEISRKDAAIRGVAGEYLRARTQVKSFAQITCVFRN